LKESELISLVDKRFKSIVEYRMPFDKQAYQNLSYYYGFQHYNEDDTFLRVDMPPEKQLRVKIVQNFIRSTVKNIYSRLITKTPEFSALSATDDPDDIEKAAISEFVLKTYFQREFTPSFLQEFALAVVALGCHYMKVFWEPEKGKATEIDGELVPTGDIAILPVSRFEMYVDKEASSLSNADWIIYAKEVKTSWVKDNFENGDKVKDENAEENSSVIRFGKKLQNFFFATGSTSVDAGHRDDRTVIKEYWESPTKKYPKGRVITIGGGILLDYKEENPYDHGKFPFVEFYADPSVGRNMKDSPITSLIPGQRIHNKIIADILEHYSMFKPKILIPDSCKLEEDAWDNIAGEKVYYQDGGATPQVVMPPPVSGDMFNFLQANQAFFEKVSGITPAMEGGSVPNMRTASGMAMLQETGNAVHIPIQQVFEHALINQAGSMILSIAHQFVSDERISSLVGPNNLPDIKRWRGSDLVTDVRVVGGAILPESTILRMELGLAWMKEGLFHPDRAQERQDMMTMLNLGNFNRPNNASVLDSANAKKENTLLLNGQTIPTNDVDDHQIHLTVHVNKYKQILYDDSTNPMGKETLLQHIMETQQRLAPPPPQPPPQEMPMMPPQMPMPQPMPMPEMQQPMGPPPQEMPLPMDIPPEIMAQMLQEMQAGSMPPPTGAIPAGPPIPGMPPMPPSPII
jgi:hypothetical protein